MRNKSVGLCSTRIVVDFGCCSATRTDGDDHVSPLSDEISKLHLSELSSSDRVNIVTETTICSKLQSGSGFSSMTAWEVPLRNPPRNTKASLFSS